MNKASQEQFERLMECCAGKLTIKDPRVKGAEAHVKGALNQLDNLIAYVQLAVQEYDSESGISRGTINKLQELST